MKVYERITDLIGHTPLLKLNHLIAEKELGATVLAKLEYFNPAGSVKEMCIRDRFTRVDAIPMRRYSGRTSMPICHIASQSALAPARPTSLPSRYAPTPIISR